jgi:hypothetical protein
MPHWQPHDNGKQNAPHGWLGCQPPICRPRPNATAVHEFANDVGRPSITNNNVMDVLYTVIFNTGVMCEECKKWEDKATADKTYEISKPISPRPNENSSVDKKQQQNKGGSMEPTLSSPTNLIKPTMHSSTLSQRQRRTETKLSS